MRFIMSTTIWPSDLASPTGSTTLLTRWMRRSPLVKVPLFFQKRRTRQHHCGRICGFADKNFLHYEQVERSERHHMVRIGIGLHQVFAHDPHRFEAVASAASYISGIL
jgi:hypothetical protein